MFDITATSPMDFTVFKKHYLQHIDTGEPYATEEFMAAVQAAMKNNTYHVVEEDDLQFDSFSYKPINVKEKMYVDDRWPNSFASFITHGTWRLFQNCTENVVGENINLLCISVADAFTCYLAKS